MRARGTRASARAFWMTKTLWLYMEGSEAQLSSRNGSSKDQRHTKGCNIDCV